MTESPAARQYSVSVRELVEFTAKQGDLDLRFTPSPTAQEGIAGHMKVSLRRGPGYDREVPLQTVIGSLLVKGRADGYNAAKNELEEIKTYRGRLERMPENHRFLHWAQVKFYGAMMCEARKLQSIKLTLVYFDVAREKETLISETHEAAALHAFIEEHCQRFSEWSQQESAHRLLRDAQIDAMKFPFDEFHAGQRQLAEAVYRSARDKTVLMAQAPTGIGKTLGTLFPALKACGSTGIDRIFFLAAKTSGRQLAFNALDQLEPQFDGDHALRSLELVAREKVCEHLDKACHGESCPLAKGFYDRLAAARKAAVQLKKWDQASVRSVAIEHGICPYYLSQELARWADVIVGDYNYYFSPSALLFALTLANEWRVSLLVDEAHNLIERGRGMYSAELDQNEFAQVRRLAPPPLKRSLDKINREWNRVHRDQEQDYEVREYPPQELVDSLGKFSTAVNDYLSEQADTLDGQTQMFYFDSLAFRAMAEVFGEHSIFDVTLASSARQRTRSRLCLRNIVPAPFLAERFKAANSCTLFSATLFPFDFYRDLLGLPDDVQLLDVPSPFQSEQLQVLYTPKISTRYAHRESSIAPITELMADQYARQPGNYLAFFSSFDYLNKVADDFSWKHPEIPISKQHRRMPEADRNAFLARFTADSQGIGFAVLGGAFAEGIDLPGSQLIGAFVATLGLPQLNPITEQIKQRTDALFQQQGYDYTYLYPGIQKVVQAAGRVIRNTTDEGTLLLMDDRYGQARIRRLLPTWWNMRPVWEVAP